MSRIVRIIDRTIDLVFHAACLAMIFAWILTCTDVIMRYFLSRPILWSVEVSEYILAGTTFLSAAYVLKKEGHVAVDSAIRLLGPKKDALITAITSGLGAGVCLLFFWFGVLKTIDQFQLGRTTSDKTLDIPFYLLLAIMPLGFLLFTLQFLRRSHSRWMIWREMKELKEGPEESFDI